MKNFFTEYEIDSYKPAKLFGVSDESQKIFKFCNLVWSNDWVVKRDIYNFNPTILLHGSPGTGKTTLLKNIAKRLEGEGFKYFYISLELLLDKDLGMSSKNLNEFFKHLGNLASTEIKIFVHFDDVDSVLCSRYIPNESSGVKRLVNTFIKEIDKIESMNYKYPPIITATTNMYSMIDTAVKRRFSLKFSIENNITISEFEMWLKPIISDLGMVDDFDYFSLYEKMNQKKLTNYDVYLIMQSVFLDKIAGNEISFETIALRFELTESSNIGFENSKASLSRL
ncbi:AAA family ATPase [Klebsiella variicola]|uniref:ATP-binding protein n=1 Tax=Klebsiella pneumoniae complex TaxID=3390273 RepID=UPI0022B66302|nr:AAA family ATPase [Klebsiella pneumoniae]MCZ7739425.1 AAA family ATPase [Klebsiella pneumoniae]